MTAPAPNDPGAQAQAFRAPAAVTTTGTPAIPTTEPDPARQHGEPDAAPHRVGENAPARRQAVAADDTGAGPSVLTGRATRAGTVGGAVGGAIDSAVPASATRATALASTQVVPPWAEAAADSAGGPDDRAPRWLPGGAHRWRTVLLLAQIALCQVALVLLVTSWGRPAGSAAALVGAAVVLVAMTAVRHRGRWLYQWSFALVGYLCRRHRHLRAADVAPARGLLDAVSPAARVEALDAGPVELGVLDHAGGVAAVFVPTQPGQPAMFGTTSQALLAAADLLPPQDADGPAVTVQLVMHAVLPPRLRTSRASASYLQLAGNRVPVHQSGWMVVQAQRDVAHLSDESLHTALRNTVRRLLRRTRKEGRPLDPVPAENLLSVVGAICTVLPEQVRGVYSPDPSRRAEVFRERWTGWRAGGGEHAVLALHHLDDRAEDQLDEFLADLVGVPATAVTLSVSARRAGELVETETVVDLLAADRRSLHTATRAAVSAARRHGATLSRLDGYQRRAVANVLPLGGFLPW